MNEELTGLLEEMIQEDSFLYLSKKVLERLETLINKNMVETPIKPEVLLDLAIGAVADAQVKEDFHILNVFADHEEFIRDKVYFEKVGEYGVHEVLAQVVCFRLIKLMEEYLDHVGISYVSSFSE
jgi:hypothetical protein